MKYYQINNSENEKIIGFRNQINQFNLKLQLVKNYQNFELITNHMIHNNNLPVDQLPSFSNFLLDNRAKLTDVIACNPMLLTQSGFLINGKVKNIFDQFSVPYTYHDAIIHGNGHKQIPKKSVNYFYIDIKNALDFNACLYNNSHVLDYEKCVFEVNDSPASINTYNDFVNTFKHSQTKKMIPTKLVLLKPMDIIRLPGETGILCSEQLKNILEKESITGYDFIDLNIDVSHV